MTISRAALPAGDLGIARSLNNLANLLNFTSRHEGAEPLYREALAINQAALPVGHPEISINIKNLADLLMATNRGDEAQKLLKT
jgi:hypothetical protein